jgi:hypothetical protein
MRNSSCARENQVARVAAPARRVTRAAALAVLSLGAFHGAARAADSSPPVILQWFESSYDTIEKRTPDVFMAGYGSVWTPPPGRADQGNFSVGYDVYDRFDLGSAGNPTMYGTETGIKTLAKGVHRAGLNFHVDFVLNHNGYSGTGDAASRAAFKAAGGYPGFFLEFFNDADGDFNSAFASGDLKGRLAGLIDIAHEKNYRAIRNPVPGFANNIAPGTTAWHGRIANLPSEDNRRFYPDRNGTPMMLFDPVTGERDIPCTRSTRPTRSPATPSRRTRSGYVMRNAQWLVQVVGVDGLRIDAAKHVDGYVLDYLDRAVYRQNPRKLLDGSTNHVFSYSEVFDGDAGTLLSHVKKNINDADPGRVGGNRDALDFKLHFALKNNLESAGSANAWHNIKDASIDFADDGRHNGSAGVKFVHNHDVYKPFALDNVAHAYMLMMPGNASVYFNGKEFGDNRDFPKPGRGDALSVGRADAGGSPLTKLLDARNTHGRGNYAERLVDSEGLYVFERVSSAVVGLSNRGDGGYDDRTVEVGFAPGTHLIELTGNHAGAADPYGNIPEVVTVYNDGGKSKVNLRVPRNRNANNDWTGLGYVVYGLPTPQSAGGLEVSNVAKVLQGDDTPNSQYENGRQRQTDVKVITADNFQLRLKTNEVRLLGQDSLRDVFADGDNAILKVDGGRDLNGNGRVDHVTPDSVAYGFEQFGTKSSPLIGSGGINGARGDGEFLQSVNTAALEEGYHYLTARAFRHRTDGGPAVFSEWKQVIYVDRLKPVSAVAGFHPWDKAQQDDRDLFVRSTDQTADSVHVFMDLPANLSDAQVLSMVNGGNRAPQIDRDLFKYGFFDLANGNHVATIVTYEITGNVNVQRVPGQFVFSPGGTGFGDVTRDGFYEGNDVDAVFALVTGGNSGFSAAADFDGDGLMSLADWSAFGDALQLIHDAGTPKPGDPGYLLVSQGTLDYYRSLTAVVPEPGALAVLALGGCGALLRRAAAVNGGPTANPTKHANDTM